MGKRLCVILGAGASYDLVGIPVGEVQPAWRPPLTESLFENRATFQPILARYPGARSLAATINMQTNRGRPLESVMRELAASSEKHTVRRFQQVPLYLQDLLGEVSDKYTKEPVNYTQLMHNVLTSGYDKVAFVTVNYDLFLEQALESIGGRQPTELGAYAAPEEKWMLIKLHGSVNWGRLVSGGAVRRELIHDAILEFIDARQISELLDDDIQVLGGLRRWDDRGNVLYPAIAVPVEGKYGLVCPEEHVRALREFMPTCENFLFIGVSGKDQDLLDLLKDSVKQCSGLAFVSGADVEEVAKRFLNHVPPFNKLVCLKSPNGFSGFMMSGAFEEFVARLSRATLRPLAGDPRVAPTPLAAPPQS